jgi:uridine kinase
MASSPLVIGIAGGTASGKSTVAQRILEGLADATDRASNDPMPDVATFVRGDHRTKPHSSHVVMLDQDSYYREFPDLPIEDKREINWDHPDAFDSDLFVAHIQALKRGESIEKPVYSFSSYAREAQSVTLRPGAVLIVEGILVLGTDAIRKELDVRIFVDADDDVRVVRRIMRDIKERGRDFDSVVEQYFRSVRPMHQGFVEPSKRHADIIIPHGGTNDVATQMVVGALRARLGRR